MTTDRAPTSERPDFGGLVTESANPASAEIDRLSALEIARLINAEDATVAAAVAREVPAIARAMDSIATRMRAGGRLIYAGAGTSGRLGALDAVECAPTFNLPPGRVVSCLAGGTFALDAAAEDQEDDAPAGARDLARLAVGSADAVVGITASGRTAYILGAVEAARRAGALTIGLTCNATSPLAERVEIAITPVVGPEVIAGSTRLKAGTAQKMVLNMLSTGVMVLLGKTYGNLMVDVQATNAKLRARALRILQAATGMGAEEAAALLDRAGGETKTAIVMQRLGLDASAARARLAAHDGLLRGALAPEE
jgi:N-acetylmuramic acid 6-phosphate etherase